MCKRCCDYTPAVDQGEWDRAYHLAQGAGRDFFSKAEQAANRRAWVQALRSGKYRQARGSLRYPEEGTFCVLGVACEVIAERYPGTIAPAGEGGYTGPDDPVFVHYFVLPPFVQKAMGLRTREGQYAPGGRVNLTNRNDQDLWGFEELAFTIEQEPPGLLEE